MAPENPSFPAVVSCPLCQQNTLHLFDDTITDGIWLHCNACAAHGDIITFGAAIWNTSLPSTLKKFAELGLVNQGEKDHLAGDYERTLSRQHAIESFWFDAEAQIWNHGDDVIACRLRELGVYHEINASGLVGVAHKDQVVKLCAALGRAKPTKLRENGATLVFPFYDLPGRLTGVLLVQYADDFTSKSTFVPTTGYRRQRPDAGYFLLHSALRAAPTALRGAQFIVDDPFWALSAQCTQLKRGLNLLPIMSSYNGTEANSYGTSWQAFPVIPRLFHGSAITPELISRACAAKGYVCVTPLTHKTKSPNPILEQLANIHKHAETWQTSLQHTLHGMSEVAAYSFASRLLVPHEKLNLFFKKTDTQFSPGFVTRVLNSVSVTPAAPTKAHRRWIVIEKENGWWNHIGHQVCSARVVIEKIVQSDTGDRSYVGKIYVDDIAIDFVDSAQTIENMGLLAYAAATAASSGKLIVFDRAWNRRSHLLAIQLHQPELVVVSSRMGWDDRNSVFRFADYAIDSFGCATDTTAGVTRKNRIIFPRPTLVGPPAIRQFLTPSYENAFVWNVVAAVATNLLAPILRKDNIATGIIGENFAVAAKLGGALGCRHLRLSMMQKNHVSKQLTDSTHELDWPLFASSEFNDATFNSSIVKCHNRPLLSRLTAMSAAVAPGYNWQIIQGTAPPANTDFSVFQHILPAYIQRSLRNRMRLAAQDESFTRAVIRDLHEWLTQTYEASFQLSCAQNQLLTPELAHVALLTELNTAIQAEKLAVLPRPRRKDQPQNYVLRRKDNWWLNQRAIDRYFYTERTTAPNWLIIVDLLLAAGLFAGEEVIHGANGILVNTAWCDQFWRNTNSIVREIG